ncbi:hypothetical protein APA_1998 [Pseudanabaena sp. lw0831]|uniref:DUF4419 domain-containing protein n=1 Tax=Pseudanabaena sp. lw0831 TaxID=1357935 RepID=UPI0019151F4F|nr:DUF4419 domain-containing protein [Pseudanabaena sp. lw0831]GBO54050.1 hypothetical protein APA_1998 [Pseudanabaena sp. lw0831]
MSSIATVLEETVSQIRFCVDDVELAKNLLPVNDALPQLEEKLGRNIITFSHEKSLKLIVDAYVHPLAHAVHSAFSDHRPLVLTPDIIWITIAQGFAQHVNNNAEKLRSHFVQHEGKQKLVVEILEIPKSGQRWSDLIQDWTLQIRDHVGADLYRLIECTFSTTTPITQTVSHIVMMDTFQQYFDYEMRGICGIPDITLMGTVDDWQDIYTRVQSIAQYDLGWWTNRVLPICREFVKTASGNPSLSFWQAIYKPKKIYGGELITGWLAELFPYLKYSVTEIPSVRNPILSIARVDLTVDDGISPKSIPIGLSQVPVTFILPNNKYNLELVAGFLGVCQNEGGELKPEIGWALRQKEGWELKPELGWALQIQGDRFAELLNKIQREHITQVPIDWTKFEFGFDSVPKEIVQLLDRFNGATLFADSGHSWKISKYNNTFSDTCTMYKIAWSDQLNYQLNYHDKRVTNLIDLEDGRCIAYNSVSIIVLGDLVLRSDASDNEICQFELENVVIIAKSIPDLFERILQAKGEYYFDDPNFENIQ